MAEAGEYMSFSFNADKGKCFGVSEETAAACEEGPVADESEKWTYYEFWCSEGYMSEEIDSALKLQNKAACDADAVDVQDAADLDACLLLAMDNDLMYFSYDKKKEDCHLPTDSADQGFTECVDDTANGGMDNTEDGKTNNFYKKSKTYMVDAYVDEFISLDYLCGDSLPQITMVAESMKCADVSTADGMELTIAECNDFAYDMGYDWFTYREDQGVCWYGSNEEENNSCRTGNQSPGNAWDIYAACGHTSEMLSDEQMACQGKEDCMGEECFVMWYPTEQSWKCDGATQQHSGQQFEACVDVTMEMEAKWMNYRTSNGACAAVEECVPKQSGSSWQILLNCAVVEMA